MVGENGPSNRMSLNMSLQGGLNQAESRNRCPCLEAFVMPVLLMVMSGPRSEHAIPSIPFPGFVYLYEHMDKSEVRVKEQCAEGPAGLF